MRLMTTMLAGGAGLAAIAAAAPAAAQYYPYGYTSPYSSPYAYNRYNNYGAYGMSSNVARRSPIFASTMFPRGSQRLVICGRLWPIGASASISHPCSRPRRVLAPHRDVRLLRPRLRQPGEDGVVAAIGVFEVGAQGVGHGAAAAVTATVTGATPSAASRGRRRRRPFPSAPGRCPAR